MHGSSWLALALVGLAIGARVRASASGARGPAPALDLHFIASGPLAAKCGLTCEADIPADRWAALARALFELLGSEPSAHDARVHRYYLPVYFWIRGLLDARTEGSPALCVGLQCMQGGGKSTLVGALEALFRADGGVHCAVASLDDFYLPRDGLDCVSRRFADNRLLQVRGNPQTHDMELCVRTVEALRDMRAARGGGAQPEPVLVPRFDKAAFGGRGDRLPRERWVRVAEPPDVVLLEGWCLGFRSTLAHGRPRAALRTPELGPVDEALLGFEPLYALLDGLIVAQVASPRVVFTWREQAEAAARAAGRGAMSEEQVFDFVGCYMPAYEQYLPQLYSGGGEDGEDGVCAGKPQLRFDIDDTRTPCA